MRVAIFVVVAFAVVLAGCALSPGGSPTTGATETPTRTVTQTATPGPPVPPNATNLNTVDFGNLSDRRQAVFRDALDGPVDFGPQSEYVDAYPESLFDAFEGNDYVRYEGRYYRIETFSISYGYTSFTIEMKQSGPPLEDPRQTEQPPNDPGRTESPNDPVVSFQNLPEEHKQKLRAAIEAGEYRTAYSPGGSLPAPFQYSYVRYRNETYTPVQRMIRDAPRHTLRVTPYGNATDDDR